MYVSCCCSRNSGQFTLLLSWDVFVVIGVPQHGTQHVLDAMMADGHEVNTIFLCGGGSQNDVFVQVHADVTGNNTTIVS